MTPPPAAAWRNPLWKDLRCFHCERQHSLDRLATVCEACGLPLRVDFDLAPGAGAPPPPAHGAASLWRWAPWLPVASSAAVTLGEGATPLVEVAANLFVKDEAQNPTGSFKARGMSLAVSAARALGAQALRAPSAGNAAGALAAYGAAASLRVVVAMPEDTPRAFIEECRHYGAEVLLVAGTIADAGRHLREHGPQDAFDLSTLREPHRVEGKKTMGYELWDDLAGSLPDVVIYPTGGGTGLIGMWKAWRELRQLGWTAPDQAPPRMVAVQAEGCAPVVRAFRAGLDSTAAFPDPVTRAWGLRVPSPLGGFVCLRALRETAGTALTVSEAALERGATRLARASGLDICPEGGAAFAAYEELRRSGWIGDAERVVLFNTGTGLKYRV